MKNKILLAALLFGATAGYGQWRPITAEEEKFVQAVEARVNKILLDAAHKMPGKWEVMIKTDQFQRHELDDANHRGRPHEVRIQLYMDYKPNDAEMEQMDKEIFAHAAQTAKHDPIPEELNRENPEFRWHLFASFVVNYYGFMPAAPADIPALGYETNTPGAVFSFVQWRKMGIGAPTSYHYFGDFKRVQTRDGQRIVENFSSLRECRAVKTVVLQVQSEERLIEKFIAALERNALQALVQEQ